MTTVAEIPKRRWRQRARWRWFLLKSRTVRLWLLAVAPYKLHPDRLDGVEGEPPHFLRSDLAKTPDDVVDYFVAEWGIPREDALDGMRPVEDIDRVWMVAGTGPHPYDDDAPWYDVVKDWRRGAVEYWRWDW